MSICHSARVLLELEPKWWDGLLRVRTAQASLLRPRSSGSLPCNPSSPWPSARAAAPAARGWFTGDASHRTIDEAIVFSDDGGQKMAKADMSVYG
jgi:hypothetical protein